MTGSSKIKISGSPSKAPARPRRWPMPKEKPPAFFLATSLKPTSSSTSLTREVGIPLDCAIHFRCAAAERFGCTALASSKHPKAAQAFLKWITGKGGQEVLKTGTSFEYAVGKGADSNPALVPLKDLQAPKVEPSKLNSKKVTDLMTEVGLL